MDVEELSVPYGRAGDHIPCWLHPAHSKTLVLLIHGHNSYGDTRQFRALAESLQEKGVTVCRYTVLREETPKGLLVNTITEEIAQAKTVLEHVRYEYNNIVVAGHSQGGIIALQLCIDGDADAAVFLMSVVEIHERMQKRLTMLKTTIDELQAQKYAQYTTSEGVEMLYTPAFFEDFETWDVLGMLTQWYGPSLFVAGTKDQRVSVDEVEQGFSVANEPKQYFEIDSDHNFPEKAAEIGERVFSFIQDQGLLEDDDVY